ncbi:MAG: hypothetical protein ABIT76_08880 [Chthoniobacterales bacterium]
MNSRDKNLLIIWEQKKIPIVYRQGGAKPLLIRLPFARDNRAWLKERPRQKEPQFLENYKCWEIPKSRFEEIVEKSILRYKQVYVIQPYRKHEVCAPSCMNASGFECECSCLGANHGRGNQGNWFEIAETLSVRWSEREYACRLITQKSDSMIQ